MQGGEPLWSESVEITGGLQVWRWEHLQGLFGGDFVHKVGQRFWVLHPDYKLVH